jgi:hypothetical protein
VIAGAENTETSSTTFCRLSAGTCGFTNAALFGMFDGVNGRGVLGIANQTGGTGVRGEGGSGGAGVFGSHSGTTGIGVHGRTGGTGTAVFGEATANGAGVFGDSVSGPGVQARSTTGPALNVLGRAQFSNSGIAVVQADRSTVTVSNVPLNNASLVLALIQGNVSGTWVRGVVLDLVGDKFTIRLNKVVPSTTFVGWFVVN